ncbi:uncharacterized protein LOC144746139 [Ciona intestinalis]
MPATHCSIPGCSTDTKYSKLSIFTINKFAKGNLKNWHQQLENVIRKYRDSKSKDDHIEDVLHKGNAGICELHFDKEDIKIYPVSGRKQLKHGAMPKNNLPFRVGDKPPATTRAVPVRIIPNVHNSLSDIFKSFSKIKRKGWTLENDNQHIILRKVTNSKFSHPDLLVAINTRLQYKIICKGFHFPVGSFTLFSSSLPQILNEADEKANLLCPGITTTAMEDKVISYYIELKEDYFNAVQPKYLVKKRSSLCTGVVNDKGPCAFCKSLLDSTHNKPCETVDSKRPMPLKLNAPLSRSSKNRLVETIKQQRKQSTETEKSVSKLLLSPDNTIDIKGLESDINSICNTAALNGNLTDFQKIFWETQKSILSETKVKYHPEIIRFALSLQSKSNIAYEQLRGILRLPSKRTLYDYRNVFSNTTGINQYIIDALLKQSKEGKHHEKFVYLVMDEMKIRENLVFKPTTNEIIGFTDCTTTSENLLAKYMLVVYVKSCSGNISRALGFYPTETAKGFHLVSIFWAAVESLEVKCDLKVVAAVCDGSTNNKNFFKLLAPDEQHKIPNPFTVDSRNIFLLTDPPHLIKTARNCLYGSKPNGPRLMQRPPFKDYIMWNHFVQTAEMDIGNDLHCLPKLNTNHVYLTPFSKMNVSIAAQTLSRSVSLELKNKGFHSTSEYCLMFNRFFDLMNTTSNFSKASNPDLRPYTEQSDPRLLWLEEDFLNYFTFWKSSLDENSELTKLQRQKMFISNQTFQALVSTVNAMVGLIRNLLQMGVSMVCTRRINQDVLEHYFGQQRSIGRRSENPDVAQFLANDRIIAVQRELKNIRGSNVRMEEWKTVSNEPLPKRKK